MVDSVWQSAVDSIYGSHGAHWIGFYDYFRVVCGLEKQTEKLNGMKKVALNAGWWLPHRDICWISERHNTLRRDERGRLHCENGPAVEYPDGWKIYASHGVRLPDYIIERPGEISVEKIDSEPNAEIRRVMIEKFGKARFIKESGAEQIHKDDYGILWNRQTSNGELISFVEVINATPEPDGSFRNYFLRVPPAMKTARNAVAWTFGKERENLYAPTIQT